MLKNGSRRLVLLTLFLACVQFALSALGLDKFVQDQRFDGTSGYVIDTMQGNRDITGEQLDAMKNAQFPSPLLNYKGMGTTVELAGKEKVGDRDAYVLIGKPKAGPVIRYYIDAETYLPIRSVMKIMVRGTEVEQMQETSDFREVDSVKV